MISPVRATATVGLGSVISLAASVVAAKVLAVVIGPEGVGLLGVLQSLLGIVALLAGLGVTNGVVRAIAAQNAQGTAVEVAATRQAASLLVLGSGLIWLAILLVFREPVAQTFLGSSARSGDLWYVAPALVITLLTGVELGIINGYHRLTALTLTGVVNALMTQAVLIGFVLVWGSGGIAPAILISSLAALVVAFLARSNAVGVASGFARTQAVRRAMRSLLRFGGPYTVSALVGSGAQLIVPIIVLNELGQGEVGHYRAAATISVGYLAFLLTAFAQDYYPRVAAARPEELLDLIERRMRLVMALAVPVILTMMALAPLAIQILYTDAFLPATQVLEWQLVGDLLKLPAWTLAFVILARGSSGRFFLIELLGGAVLLVTTLIGTATLGLVGAGIGYFVSYAVYYPVVWLAVRKWAPATPGRLQLAIIGLVVIVLIILALPRSLIVLRTAVLCGLAAGTASLAWPRMWRLHRAGEL